MPEHNPLDIFQRKPLPVLNLPSQGRWWGENSIEYKTNMDVYSMTGRDEFMLLNASPLLLNSILVELFHRCIPGIKDAWQMPRIDIDTAVIAIRIASYGENMRMNHTCPHCKADNESEVNLSQVTNAITIPNFNEPVVISDDIVFYVKPMNLSDDNASKIEQNRRLAAMNEITDQNISPEEQAKLINENLWSLTDATVRRLARNIERVIARGNPVTEQKFIEQWILDADRESYSKISQGISSKLSEYSMPKQRITCTACGNDFEAEIGFMPNEFLNSEQNQGS